MPEDRNKIAQGLTVEQLDQFVTELAALPGRERTLEKIKHKAAQLGIMISVQSAKAFRDTTFERHLEKLRRAQEVASQVEEIEKGGTTLADASAKLLSKRIFDQLIEAEDDDSSAEIDVDALTLAVSRLRRGNQQDRLVTAALEVAQAKVREYEAREADRQKKAAEVEKDETLNDEQKAAKWRQIFGMQ